MNTPRWQFPIARRVWKLARSAAANWRERHRHPVSYALHLVGIPLALAGLWLLLVLPWQWGVGLIAGGYFLQWVGHRVEGNDLGELIPVRRALGLPVVAVAPRPARPAEAPRS